MALVKANYGFKICAKLPSLVRGLKSFNVIPKGRELCEVSQQRVTSLSIVSKEDEHLLSAFNRLCVSPAELNASLEYVLPTLSYHSKVRRDTFLPSTSKSGIDCPTSVNLIPLTNPDRVKSIIDPISKAEIQDPQQVVEKFAKNILKIRRRKMNRHHLKKLRKRMKFVYRKRRHRKMKLKEAKVQAEFRAMMKRAEDFDPEKWVQENLEQARKGGFHVNIFASNSNK